MDLEELQQNWNEFGKRDPLWAILTDPGRRGGKWGVEEFLASGRAEISAVMRRAREFGFPAHHEAALDFGCGVGRLSQARCSWFERCRGVDIAPSMIELARQHNRHGEKCEYFLNLRGDLEIFPDDSFDLVYSNIVLQHMQPRYSTAYIREFVRVVRPGGLVVFQIPDGRMATDNAAGPLPDSGFGAMLSGYPASLHTVAGSRINVPVTVRNLGDVPWPCRGDHNNWNYAVQLGNHWLHTDGDTAVWDDGRQPLPCDLAPNAEMRMILTVTTPVAAGKYILELDMVQEAVSWFKHKFSTAASIPVEVEPAPISTGLDTTPRMEMYGVGREEAIGILSSSGARLLDILPDGSSGAKWVAFKYFATKS
jgi:SAM-dependent methyltransferase